MPSIHINSKGTTIKLTRAEVRAMQTTYDVLSAISWHHPEQEMKEIAAGAKIEVSCVLEGFGESVTPESKGGAK
jgi:predicted transcriptional regulator